MLGKERARLILSLFGFFLTDDTKLIFKTFLDKIFNIHCNETCEVTLSKDENQPMYAQLSGIVNKNGEQCLIYLSHHKHNSYAYFVQPDCGLAEINKPDYLKDVKILSNTPDIQAIQNRDGVMAVFYKPSSLKVSEAETILTNHPCILIYKLNHNEKEVWVSDPTRKLKSIQIQIRNKTINVTLPIGNYAGSAVNVLVP